MRCISLAAVLAIVPITGCSAIVAGSGKKLEILTTRAQVRDCFGTPRASGTTPDGLEFDEFKTHRKISDISRGEGICMGFVATLGLYELYSFPKELLIAGSSMLRGYELRFVYRPDGTVKCNSGGGFFSQPFDTDLIRGLAVDGTSPGPEKKPPPPEQKESGEVPP